MTPQISAPAGAVPSPLVGPEKVAILLLALGRPKATQLLQQFDPDDLHVIRTAAAKLRPVTASDLAVLVDEFAKGFANGVNFLGTPEEVENLLADIIQDDPIEEELFEVEEEPIWEKISELKEDVLGPYVEKEHPQTAALIMSRISSDLAASVLASFQSDMRSEVMQRMLDIEDAPEDAVQAVEQALREDLIEASTGEGNAYAGPAGILNKLEKEQQEEVLSVIESVDAEKAKTLRGMLFAFEDIATLDEKARTKLFDKVSAEKVVVALKGAEPELLELVLSVLAPRARRTVEAELKSANEPAPDAIVGARRAIADTVLEMASEGEIDLASDDEADG